MYAHLEYRPDSAVQLLDYGPGLLNRIIINWGHVINITYLMILLRKRNEDLMVHEFEFIKDETKHTKKIMLYMTADKHSAISMTVGYTVGAAAQLILNGVIREIGVKNTYDPKYL